MKFGRVPTTDRIVRRAGPSTADSLAGHAAVGDLGGGTRLRVCMFVYNNCTRDVRVMKEANALARAGHTITIVAVLDPVTVPEEWRDGIRIVRIARNPPHYRLLRLMRAVSRIARLSRARVARAAELARRASRRDPAALSRLSGLARAWRLRLRGAERDGPPRAGHVLAGPVSLLLRIGEAGFDRLASQSVEVAPAGQASPTSSGTPIPGPLWAGLRWGNGALRKRLLLVHKPLMFADYYLRARAFARSEPADVYHAHDLNTLPAAALAARDHRARLIYDAHELYTEISTLSPRERRIWRVVERLLIGRANGVVTVCESIADELRRRYRIERPMVLLNCPEAPSEPIPPGNSLLRAELGLDAREPIVLYHGGFMPNRGLPALVRAGALLDSGVIVLMGWGSLEPQLAALIEELQLHARVRLAAPVPQTKLLRYVAGADVGVIPYEPVGLNNTFTTPNKLFDYMAVGLPIAASRLPELERFVDGLGVGVTFAQATPTLIAEAIRDLLNDPDRAAAMRSNGLLASRKLRWQVESEKLIAMYDTIDRSQASDGTRGRLSPPSAVVRRPRRNRGSTHASP